MQGGYFEHGSGDATDHKIHAIWKWPALITQLRIFLRTVGYCRCYVSECAFVTKPLTVLAGGGEGDALGLGSTVVRCIWPTEKTAETCLCVGIPRPQPAIHLRYWCQQCRNCSHLITNSVRAREREGERRKRTIVYHSKTLSSAKRN